MSPIPWRGRAGVRPKATAGLTGLGFRVDIGAGDAGGEVLAVGPGEALDHEVEVYGLVAEVDLADGAAVLVFAKSGDGDRSSGDPRGEVSLCFWAVWLGAHAGVGNFRGVDIGEANADLLAGEVVPHIDRVAILDGDGLASNDSRVCSFTCSGLSGRGEVRPCLAPEQSGEGITYGPADGGGDDEPDQAAQHPGCPLPKAVAVGVSRDGSGGESTISADMAWVQGSLGLPWGQGASLRAISLTDRGRVCGRAGDYETRWLCIAWASATFSVEWTQVRM